MNLIFGEKLRSGLSGKSLILSVDIGTSGTRAILYDARAHHVSQVSLPYPILFPAPNLSEQYPEQIASAAIAAIRRAVAAVPPGDQLEGIVFSSQMYSVLVLDEHGTPVTNSLLWSDQRGADQAAILRSMPEAPVIRDETGCPIQAVYPLSKILWLRENLDLPTAARFVSIKDYVILRLTNRLITDWSTASASGLFDIVRLTWSQEALHAIGVSEKELPELASPRHVLDEWDPEIARRIGISPRLPLILGAGDAPMANIGVGAIESDSLAVNVGSSAAARVLLTEPLVDPLGRLWTYVADEGRWVIGGIIGAGGAAYDWLVSQVLGKDPDSGEDRLFDRADDLAGSVRIGSDDLLFLPFLTGEQSPGWDTSARGVIHGLTLRHESAHVIRAALEGLAFSLLRVVEAIEQARGAKVQRAYLTGGVTSSRTWRRIITDVLAVPVSVPESHEASARGAAILGWLALGREADYGAFPTIETRQVMHPDEAARQSYQRQYQSFCRLIDNLQSFAEYKEASP